MSFSQPKDLASALSILEDAEPRIIAGGTDVYPAMQGKKRCSEFLDVTRIDGFTDVTLRDDYYRIGAAVTWSDIIKAELPPAFEALKQAARTVGSVQIQNAATLVGNICNASPAADGVPPLLALDAEVELAGTDGVRVMPLSKFIVGVRRTALRKKELCTAIKVPRPASNMRSKFEKLGSRSYLVISIAMTAVNVLLDDEGRIAEAKVAVGACSAAAQRLTALEVDLVGADPRTFEIKAHHLAPLRPIDDVRGTGAYRLDAVGEQIRRALLGAIAG